mmetsp:Transcript_19374/g.51719  ORF Transcript_19374/g.51719 Transcript_19374/m.51719 type:complete len:212 (+) Transcript_19374:224-859(+)
MKNRNVEENGNLACSAIGKMYQVLCENCFEALKCSQEKDCEQWADSGSLQCLHLGLASAFGLDQNHLYLDSTAPHRSAAPSRWILEQTASPHRDQGGYPWMVALAEPPTVAPSPMQHGLCRNSVMRYRVSLPDQKEVTMASWLQSVLALTKIAESPRMALASLRTSVVLEYARNQLPQTSASYCGHAISWSAKKANVLWNPLQSPLHFLPY